MSNNRPIRIAIAGGGTGGHVLPALSVIEELERRGVPMELLWIGSKNGVEGSEARARGISFRAVSTGKFRRYPDIKTVTDAVRVPLGVPAGVVDSAGVQARRDLQHRRLRLDPERRGRHAYGAGAQPRTNGRPGTGYAHERDVSSTCRR